jgi:hypothetical protein
VTESTIRHIRVQRDIDIKVAELAHSERRPITQMITILLEEALDARAGTSGNRWVAVPKANLPAAVDPKKEAAVIIATTKTGIAAGVAQERADGARKHRWIDNATFGKVCSECGQRKNHSPGVIDDCPGPVDGNV